jgi:protein SCO1/2
LFLVPLLLAAKSFSVEGIVVAVDPAARTMLVAHRPIGKFMPAMTMPFRVEQVSELNGLYPGARVRFELVVDRDRSMAKRVVKTADGEIAPPAGKLRTGDTVADFELLDQQSGRVRLSELRGKVVAVNFIYTRCPLPDVCPRLSANFAALQRRFGKTVGRDLVLLTVTVDPEYDTPAILAEYAKRWGAAWPGWRFLTGDVSRVAAQLGEVYWTDEGSIGHNSAACVIGRDGRLAAAVEGTNWRVDQFASLIEHALEGAQ